jgi:hypothetical protein
VLSRARRLAGTGVVCIEHAILIVVTIGTAIIVFELVEVFRIFGQPSFGST